MRTAAGWDGSGLGGDGLEAVGWAAVGWGTVDWETVGREMVGWETALDGYKARGELYRRGRGKKESPFPVYPPLRHLFFSVDTRSVVLFDGPSPRRGVAVPRSARRWRERAVTDDVRGKGQG